jgi:hypothetical protein
MGFRENRKVVDFGDDSRSEVKANSGDSGTLEASTNGRS